ncbi:hypothetical protein [Yinghuangia sp. YIM S09857]|uniref:TetR/AcrR family transcriptional regulator n=1 Tax=Yinghuangia sp. YIM S09857 TaxID=3436929 RepID=UPI003F536B49
MSCLRDVRARPHSPAARPAPASDPLIATQLLGLAMALHVTPMAALRDADTEHVTALVAPTVQRYLTTPCPRRRRRWQHRADEPGAPRNRLQPSRVGPA